MKDFDYLVSRPHQDSALWPTNSYFSNVWIPLVNVTKYLAPICLYEGNLQEKLLPHIKNEYEQYEIAEKHLLKELKEDIIEIDKGKMLFFSPSQIHCSMPNLTNKVRWSFDFRLIEEIQYAKNFRSR
jgi:ectoine hydroxylase-related dioxygenase (phytanoyl-CoA dioxygenase family)